jgi:hypothetical protein
MAHIIATCTECGARDEYPAPPPGEIGGTDCTACGVPIRIAALPGTTQVAVPDATTIEQLLEGRALPVLQWAAALMDRAEYEDDAASNPSLDIVAAILGAETSAEALAATSMRTVEDLIGTEPGAHSPVLRIYGAKPLASTYEQGPSCFAIIDAEAVASGERFKLTCGARAVQAAILAHVYRGWCPFDAVLTRRLKKTRAGFYPLNLEAGG